jgi:hypothetical protein
MAKRFTDTDKYKKPFIRGLQGAYKLLWDYLYHSCDHAGIWIVDFEIAQIYLGQDMQVNKKDALKYFNNGEQRIIEIDDNKWFIPSFVEFQYGELNEENRAHNSVLNILHKYNLINDKGLITGLQACKDKDKDKDKVKVKDKDPKFLELYHKIEKSFHWGYEKQTGLKAFSNYDKEGKSIKYLIKKAKTQNKNNPEEYLDKTINYYWSLLKTNDNYFKKKPFLPSQLNGDWDQVTSRMLKEKITSPDPEYLEFIQNLRF